MTGLLWLGPARTSTVIMGILFFTRAAAERDWRPLVGGAAWLVGFEMAYSFTGMALGQGTVNAGWLAWAGWPVAAWAVGIRPHRGLLVLTAAAWVAWVATGFHSNPHGATSIDPLGEALNEITKTALGVAYLVAPRRTPRGSVMTSADSSVQP